MIPPKTISPPYEKHPCAQIRQYTYWQLHVVFTKMRSQADAPCYVSSPVCRFLEGHTIKAPTLENRKLKAKPTLIS